MSYRDAFEMTLVFPPSFCLSGSLPTSLGPPPFHKPSLIFFFFPYPLISCSALPTSLGPPLLSLLPISHAFPSIPSLFLANHAGPVSPPAPEPTPSQACPLPPLQAEDLGLRKDGLYGRWLLGGAVPGGLRRAPAAQPGWGRLATALGELGHQHLPSARPGSCRPAGGPQFCSGPGLTSLWGSERLQPRKPVPGRVFWSWEERAQGRCSQQTLSCARSWEVIRIQPYI